MKYELRPELGRVLRGVHSAGVQGLGRPLSNLVVQVPHEAPEGESLIPSLKVAETLTQVNLDLQQLNINLGQLDKDLEAAQATLAGVDADVTAVENAMTEVEATMGTVQDTVSRVESESAAAKTAADKAVADAASAVDRALAAQSTADGLATDVKSAKEAASAAQVKADSAASSAQTAQSAADQAKRDAASAVGVAGSKADVLIQATAPAASMQKATTLWIDTSSGANTPKRWDGSKWVAVTDKAATDAASAASAAQVKADQAVADAKAAKSGADAAAASALAAQADADDALAKASTADGRYTVAAVNPVASDGTGKPVGAVWEVRAGGVSLRRFVWDGKSWVQVKAGTEFIGDKAISRAQIGDAAIGTAQIADAAITNAKVGDLNAGKINAGTLDAARIGSRSLTADKIIVGTQENLIPNGAGEFGGLGGWSPSAVTWDAADKPTGLPGSFVGGKGATGGGSVTSTGWFDVEPGSEYLFEVWLKADLPDSRCYIELRDSSGAHGTDSYVIPGFPSGGYTTANNPGASPVAACPVPTSWTKFSCRTVVKPGVNKLRVASLYFNHSNGVEKNAQVKIAGLRMMKRATGELIVDGAVTSRTLSAEAVTAGKIAAGAVQAGNIAADAVTAREIAANAVTADEIAANAVTADELAANAVVAGKIAANAVTADTVAANAITGDKIVANSVNGDRIIGNTISGDKIVGNSITANQIASNAITADELSANSVNAAALQADAITAKHTITGATLQTGASGARTVIDQAGLNVYNAANQTLVSVGQGVETGMAIRSPQGSMIPLSNVAFGSYSDYKRSTFSEKIPAGPASMGGKSYRYSGAWGWYLGTPTLKFTPWSSSLLVQLGGTMMLNWNDGKPVTTDDVNCVVQYRLMVNGFPVKLLDNGGNERSDLYWTIGRSGYLGGSMSVVPDFGAVVIPCTPGTPINLTMYARWDGLRGSATNQAAWVDFVSTWLTAQQM